MEGGDGVEGAPPGFFQEKQWLAVTGERSGVSPGDPTDPLLVVDAPLVVLAHHHLDAPFPVISFQDHCLGRAGRRLRARGSNASTPHPIPIWAGPSHQARGETKERGWA